jgi:carboxyl-terminal processing protease
MPAFDLPESAIDRIMKDKVASHQALILDLRGNGGGYELTLLRLLGHLLDHDAKLGDTQRRKGVTEVVVKSRGEKAYKGKIIVLVNSNSASSAELFARMIQLEKRGSVLGDRTAGAVMMARRFPHLVDEPGMLTANVNAYVVSITVADFVMSDGRSLERHGVTPDELILPKPEDLAVRRDPALSRATEIAGFKLEPEKAGHLFPPHAPREKHQREPKDKNPPTPAPQN